MRKVLFLVIILFFGGFTNLYSQYTVYGTLSYKNNGSTPLKNCIIYLVQDADTLNQYTTTANGQYYFFNVLPGNYSLKVKCTIGIGGLAAADALAMLHYFVKIPPILTGLNLAAGDVDASGYVNAADALMQQRRFVHQINSFPSGDWVFEVPTIVVSDANVSQNIKGLCFGDVNGTYSPPNP